MAEAMPDTERRSAGRARRPSLHYVAVDASYLGTTRIDKLR